MSYAGAESARSWSMTVSRGRLSCRMQLSLVLRICAVATCLATLSSGLAARGSQADDETLETARDLYAGAAYQDALTTLERLAQRATASDRERATIDHYRALCLLALNRPADPLAQCAERAVQSTPEASSVSHQRTIRSLARFVGSLREFRTLRR